MVKRLSLTLLVLGTVVLVGGAARPGAQAGPTAGVTMHEWGTFTTVAGPDGHPIQWLPLGGPADLPCFVDHFQNRLIKIFPGEYGDVLDYQTARSKMMATVRMETPVMYFYASQPATLNVSAKFKQGMFTEWYPKADVNQVDAYQNIFKLIGNSSASIAWKNVEVRPGATAPFATTDAPSHYYKARETDATPVDVGGQAEKFLFYRGLGQFAVPISTELVAGGRIIVRNDTGDAVPEAILFTNERGKIGYRVLGRLTGTVTVDPPALDASLPALEHHLEAMLRAEGLYAKEAAAMVATWSDSWFEEGTRVFYVMPKPAVDAVLPLQIDPAPMSTTRVFVGRMDVITPASIDAVKFALAEGDQEMLNQYGRLLQPIADRILAATTSAQERARMQAMVDRTLTSYVARVDSCK